MDEELISKKELLETTGISYGQLYRWKRKNLIPEDWFIKKSAFTGQETFFPKERILKRIEKIKDMKEDSSLTELADVFSPIAAEVKISKEEITTSSVISKPTMDYVTAFFNISADKVNFEKLLFAFVIDSPLKSGQINADEAALILKTLDANYNKFGAKPCFLFMTRKFGASGCVLASSETDIYFDENTKIVFKADMAALVTDLKMKI